MPPSQTTIRCSNCGQPVPAVIRSVIDVQSDPQGKELLLTNRLILQPLVEAEVYGKSDPARGIGSGLTSIETGLRLRYELRRELAPYVGVTWERKFFGTADFARAKGKDVSGAQMVFGLRTWF